MTKRNNSALLQRRGGAGLSSRNFGFSEDISTSPLAAGFRKRETRNIRSSVVSDSKLNLRSEREEQDSQIIQDGEVEFVSTNSGEGSNQTLTTMRSSHRYTPQDKMFLNGSSLRKAAFTLAEVLLTLGIIGVVAALTLPAFIQNYQKQVLVNQLKKTVSTITQGMEKAKVDDGVTSFWNTTLYNTCFVKTQSNSVTDCKNIMNKIFKTQQQKGTRTSCEIEYSSNGTRIEKNCVEEEVDYSTKEFYEERFDAEYRTNGKFLVHHPSLTTQNRTEQGTLFKFYDGSEMLIKPGQYSCTQRTGYCGEILIDVNGDKKPNTLGRDIFKFTLTTYTSSPNKHNYTVYMNNLYPDEFATNIIQHGWRMEY